MKGILKMIYLMVMEFTNGPMEKSMKENGKMVKEMDKENIFHWINNIKDNLVMINIMEKEL